MANNIPNNFKQLILAVAKPLLWFKYKSLYKALEKLLTPCCDPTGTAVVACNEGGGYDVTITTTNSIGFLGNGTADIFINGSVFRGTVTEPKTITIVGQTVTPGTYTVYINLYLPTNFGSGLGIYESFSIAGVVFPSCI